jgi:hypothetical protein
MALSQCSDFLESSAKATETQNDVTARLKPLQRKLYGRHHGIWLTVIKYPYPT